MDSTRFIFYPQLVLRVGVSNTMICTYNVHTVLCKIDIRTYMHQKVEKTLVFYKIPYFRCFSFFGGMIGYLILFSTFFKANRKQTKGILGICAPYQTMIKGKP